MLHGAHLHHTAHLEPSENSLSESTAGGLGGSVSDALCFMCFSELLRV